jgi:hypothetical protein
MRGGVRPSNGGAQQHNAGQQARAGHRENASKLGSHRLLGCTHVEPLSIDDYRD